MCHRVANYRVLAVISLPIVRKQTIEGIKGVLTLKSVQDDSDDSNSLFSTNKDIFPLFFSPEVATMLHKPHRSLYHGILLLN